ncbi:MAG: peroxide stress protein YaaA [Solobacterium sp.]|nr:peroxide stress protein YaaA [Solobacterium sp.]
MRVILAPAKKMRTDDGLSPQGRPLFPAETKEILAWLRTRTPAQLQALWKCSAKLAEQNIARLETMNLEGELTPAVLAYDGIAYQHMAPGAFTDEQFAWVQEHLRILSAFYGVLRPLDGVTPYRLEMQAEADVNGSGNLYTYWGRKLYDAVRDDSGVIINLASREYAQAVEPYLAPEDHWVNVTFCETAGSKLVTKAVYAKMARGEMVRWLAERQAGQPEDMKAFDRLHFHYREDLSSPAEYVFERRPI